MGVTGADTTGDITGDITGDTAAEGTGTRVTDTDGLTLTLRTADAGGTADAGYVAPQKSSFTDALCPEKRWEHVAGVSLFIRSEDRIHGQMNILRRTGEQKKN
jgi:hypothetical protein